MLATTTSGLRVLDLFSGAGGFSEGFRQAGFDVVAGIDNWNPARATHQHNGLGESIDYDMFRLVDAGGYEAAKQMAQDIQNKHGRIDVLIGSPPCTEFSYAKKGGKGNIERGMLLVRSNLVFVAALKPRYWLIENVPRLKAAIENEGTSASNHGWRVPLERLGAGDDLSGIPWVDDDYLVVPHGRIYTASEYGAPQGRRRFIAGSLNPLFTEEWKVDSERTIGDCLSALQKAASSSKRAITDPNYPHHSIRKSDLRDYFYDTRVHPMYWEEMRYLKRRHIQYGKMALPDELDRPARTIMATSNPSSREAVLFETGESMYYQGKERPLLRQPTVREVACLQGFPIDFQFVGATLSTRYKLVGNAVPCQLSYALASAIVSAFEKEGFENARQESRFQETLGRRERNQLRPIITGNALVVDEASDFGKSDYMEFRARQDKHIRRRLLSAKPWNSSALVVFENTEWDSKGRARGGFWKSCIQLGQGKSFGQVYMDHESVRQILSAIDDSPALSGLLADGQMRLLESKVVNRVPETRQLLAELRQELEKGVPFVPTEWVEFPGYFGPRVEQYTKLISDHRLRLPSALLLQTFFTHDTPDTGEYIGPIDLFDGFDAIMLKCLGRSDRNWVLKTDVGVTRLSDAGSELHPRRINPAAVGHMSGSIPLVTLLGALFSVHVLYLMHKQNQAEEQPMFQSVKKAHERLVSWSKVS